MTDFNCISDPTERDLLVALFDLSSFGRFSRNHSNKDVFSLLSSYFEIVGDIINRGGGTVVKFIGDSGLVVFPEEAVDAGVLSLRELKISGDRWLKEHNSPCRNVIKAHFGSVVCGPIGTRDDKRFDVIGDTVNTAATFDTRGFAITTQVFRKLGTESRKHFKKHTPPISYIPIEEEHLG